MSSSLLIPAPALLMLLVVAAIPAPALALPKPAPLVSCGQLGIDCPQNPTGAAIASFIFKLAAPLLTIAATIFVAALVYGGAMYIMSTGDESQAHKAKLVIIYAVLGLVIIGIAGIAVNAFLNIRANPPQPVEF